jgi:hypothetical protein
MTDRIGLYILTLIGMFAGMVGCERLGKVLENQTRLEARFAAHEAAGMSSTQEVVSIELPKIQSEVISGRTNWFYQFGPRKVYVQEK